MSRNPCADAPPESLFRFVDGMPAAQVALIEDGETLTFGDLAEDSRRVAAALAEAGLKPGDRLGVWLPGRAAWLSVFLACCRLGAVAVAINTRFGPGEVADILARAGCRGLVLEPAEATRLGEAPDRRRLDLGFLLVVGGPMMAPPPEAVAVLDHDALTAAPPAGPVPEAGTPDSPCLIVVTTGTTRRPRLVLHDQGTLLCHARQVATAFGYAAPDTVTLQAADLSGVFGICQALASLAAGRPNVLMGRFEPARAAVLIAARRVTQFNLTDEMLDHLLAEMPDRPAHPWPWLDFVGVSQFDPTLDDLAARAETRGLRVHGLFGMSEVQGLWALQPGELPLDARKQGGGRPVSPHARVRARDVSDGPRGRLLAPNQVGEIELYCPDSLMVGYDGDPEATDAALTEDGWLRSGDLGFLRADGGFVFIARGGDALRLGGFLVQPAEIEGHLLRHPSVAACQVVGVRVARRSTCLAFVLPRNGARVAEDALIAHCRAHLADFKVPVRVIALEAFPTVTSPNGPRVQRNRLRDMAQATVDTGSVPPVDRRAHPR
ncbi:AMP-binding protein [Roseospirillum parvum]|uniref:Fatty-acyl-CoA synthase n=1 Tax=Roseospirillum parvum TaxID=83401 RepID=A0A1G7WRE6_9PROT|nr:AMP-binding protein [Roseospirillum parvum]SDG74464.1 fatty-acyl-CoA synthase [Roseospirillum parvum]